MSPVGMEVAEACGVSEKSLRLAVHHLRAVKPRDFRGVPQTNIVVAPLDRTPYLKMVDNYPPSLVANIVRTLVNMGNNEKCRTKELKDFAQRMKSGEVDLRPLYKRTQEESG